MKQKLLQLLLNQWILLKDLIVTLAYQRFAILNITDKEHAFHEFFVINNLHY